MEELEYKIWFSKLKISNKKKLKLLDEFKNCKNIYNMNKSELLEKINDTDLINKILSKDIRIELEKEAEFIFKNNVKVFNIYDDTYPKKLLKISDPPTQIFLRGDVEKIYDCNIGIIGSRNASKYGENVSKNISKDFANLGINVVSGLAVGIDKYAHLGALFSGTGRTIAVLGNGLSKSVLYPMENLRIFEKIIENGGCVVSEYSCFQKACSYHFPARNRIISGLSDKLIVVEAGPKSGSLITVEFALDQGKDVYAVPGDITKYSSIGTNKLIQDGAIPFLSVNDCFV